MAQREREVHEVVHSGDKFCAPRRRGIFHRERRAQINLRILLRLKSFRGIKNRFFARYVSEFGCRRDIAPMNKCFLLSIIRNLSFMQI